MKKTIIAAAFASAAMFAMSGSAFAGYDLGAACNEAYNAESGATAEGWAEGCTCVVGKVGGDAETVAAFEGAEGDNTKWTEAGTAAVAECFPQAPAAE